jgi:phage gp45-like
VQDTVQHYSPFGFISLPEEGADVLLGEMGSASHTVAVCVDDSARCQAIITSLALQKGDSALYNKTGTVVILRGGQIILRAMTGVLVEGSLTATGEIADANGSLTEIRTTYNAHVHGGSPTPTPTMS